MAHLLTCTDDLITCDGFSGLMQSSHCCLLLSSSALDAQVNPLVRDGDGFGTGVAFYMRVSLKGWREVYTAKLGCTRTGPTEYSSDYKGPMRFLDFSNPKTYIIHGIKSGNSNTDL